MALSNEGFYTFPMFFKGYEKGSGSEMDGTTAIIIALVRLWQRLPLHNSTRNRIYNFLHGDSSPLRYIHEQFRIKPLILGSGEFGGGWMISGEWYNVVQNSLVREALSAAFNMEEEVGNFNTAQDYRNDLQKLYENMEKFFVSEDDDSWLWCIDPATMKTDESKLDFFSLRGTSSINGVAASYFDAEGIEDLTEDSTAVMHAPHYQRYIIIIRLERNSSINMECVHLLIMTAHVHLFTLDTLHGFLTATPMLHRL